MSQSTNEVAIIGAGLHPFGRFEGKSAMQMAAAAIQLALTDAGVGWKDVQFAVGGSWTVAIRQRTPDLAQSEGLRTVKTQCANAGSRSCPSR